MSSLSFFERKGVRHDRAGVVIRKVSALADFDRAWARRGAFGAISAATLASSADSAYRPSWNATPRARDLRQHSHSRSLEPVFRFPKRFHAASRDHLVDLSGQQVGKKFGVAGEPDALGGCLPVPGRESTANTCALDARTLSRSRLPAREWARVEGVIRRGPD